MKRQGFTLIELLIVIAIIGLLSTLAVTALGGARTKARDARRLADIKQLQTALEMYYSDKTDYPNPTPAEIPLRLGDALLTTCLTNTTGFTGAANCLPANTIYMGKVPSDPQPAAGTKEYWYRHRTGTNTYSITYYLEGDVHGITKGLNTATESGISSK